MSSLHDKIFWAIILAVLVLVVALLAYLIISLITGHPIDQHDTTISITTCQGKGC